MPRSGLRTFSTALGATLLLGGTAHLVGVLMHWAKAGIPEKRVIGYLLFIAYIQWVSGALHLFSRSGLETNESWARRVSLCACALMCAYTGTVMLLAPPEAWIFVIGFGLYFLAHAGLAVRLLARWS